MNSTETLNDLPNLKEFPAYVPVHPDVKPNTEFGSLLLLREIDERLSSIKNSTESFINYITTSPHLAEKEGFKVFSTQMLEAYEKFYTSKVKLQVLQQALKDLHRELVDSRRSALQLTLSNYDMCKELMKRNFADSFGDKIDEIMKEKMGQHTQELLHRDPGYTFMKNALFVLQHPEDPLQDEQADEELAVEGGKISLKDPLSMNYFSDPVVSKKCSHVFEREHILRSIRATREKYACPVTGCDAYLTESDLLPDKLMKLRVKVYMGRAKKRDHESVVRI